MEKENLSEPKPATLESLLRIKRLEQPSSEYWERFDRELHERMLQTLAARDSWSQAAFRFIRQRWIQGTSVAFAGLISLLLVNSGTTPQENTAGTASKTNGTLVVAADLTPEATPAAFEATFFASAAAGIDQADFGTRAVSVFADDPAEFTRVFEGSPLLKTAMESEALQTDYRSSAFRAGSSVSSAARLVF